MKILAVETSCDDTCLTIVEVSKKEPCFRVLSNLISSQVEVHQKWGGVYPTLAKREHQRNLVPLLRKVLKESGLLAKQSKRTNPKKRVLENILKREPVLLKQVEEFLKKYQKPEIDSIAVTVGPGLEPCLWVGVNFAKALAFSWNLPIIPINHLEAHIMANFIDETTGHQLPTTNLFPAICLVISGGHTQLILMKGLGKYKIIGETRDDAAGECFDKAARILGLSYPGGPAIAAEAAKPQTTNYKPITRLPRPMIGSKDYDFSFSGLKTAVLYMTKTQNSKRKTKGFVRLMAREIQQAIIDVLVRKTISATKNFKAKSIILGGGVSANNELRRQLGEKINKELPGIKYLVPEPCYSVDNALMVAIAAFYRQKEARKNWGLLEAQANLRI